jgi:hypothetical protein
VAVRGRRKCELRFSSSLLIYRKIFTFHSRHSPINETKRKYNFNASSIFKWRHFLIIKTDERKNMMKNHPNDTDDYKKDFLKRSIGT